MSDIILEIFNKNEKWVNHENFKKVKPKIVSDYSDSAHFVYEFIQNAEDVYAEYISFYLYDNRLEIVHNGKDFTKSNVESICDIFNSDKIAGHNMIGKFGIGFKSVFAYTDTPIIYSGEYAFKIKELMLPDINVPERKIDLHKTLFIIPFNNSKMRSSRAYDTINNKLNELSGEAILFLSNIKKIFIYVENENSKCIERITEKRIKIQDAIYFEQISISDEQQHRRYYRFKLKGFEIKDIDDEGKEYSISDQSVMIAYTLNEKGIIINCASILCVDKKSDILQEVELNGKKLAEFKKKFRDLVKEYHIKHKQELVLMPR